MANSTLIWYAISYIFPDWKISLLRKAWLALNSNGRAKRIVLANTAARIGTREGWNSRIETVLENGLSSILPATAERWFTAGFNENHPLKVQNILNDFAQTPLEVYVANCAMVRDADFTKDLHAIQTPVFIISGKYDQVTTPEHGNSLQKQISGSEHIVLEACHLSNFEKPTEFNHALIQFLNKK